jgi:hypothetical protein
MLLDAGCVNQRTQSAHRPALLADDFPHVRLRDANFDAGRSFAIDFAHVNRVTIVNEGLYD